MSRITASFLYTAQLFERPEMGSRISQTHGFDPKWKCFHPPAPMISVLSNSDHADTQVVKGQRPGMRN